MKIRGFAILAAAVALIWVVGAKVFAESPIALQAFRTLTAPTLTVTISETTVMLSWTTVAGATGYTLYYMPRTRIPVLIQSTTST